VLMDLRMPQKDGIETTKEISRKFPDIHVRRRTVRRAPHGKRRKRIPAEKRRPL
jgi:DNA-binding NarL/FixJ family response regulator